MCVDSLQSMESHIQAYQPSDASHGSDQASRGMILVEMIPVTMPEHRLHIPVGLAETLPRYSINLLRFVFYSNELRFFWTIRCIEWLRITLLHECSESKKPTLAINQFSHSVNNQRRLFFLVPPFHQQCVEKLKAAPAALTVTRKQRMSSVATLKLFKSSENSSLTLVSSLLKLNSLALKFCFFKLFYFF